MGANPSSRQATERGAAEPMSAPDDFIAGYNERDWERLRGSLADECVYEQIGRPKRLAETGDEVVEIFRGWANTAPDAKGEIVDRVDGPDGVAIELDLLGPLKAPFGDFTPAGKQPVVRAALIFHLDDEGKIRALRNYYDSLVLYQVLGIRE